MIRLRSISVLVVVGLSGAVAAQAPSAPAPADAPAKTSPDDHLLRAHTLMNDLEYLDAAHEFSMVITHADATDAQKQDARLHAGIAHRYMGNDVDSRLLFMAVLRRNPKAQLPAGDHPPKLVTFFELVRDEAKANAAAQARPAPRSPPQSGRPAPLPPADPRPSPTRTRTKDTGGLSWMAISGSVLSGCAGCALAGCGGWVDATVFATGVAGGGNSGLDAIDFLGPSILLGGVGLGLLAVGLVPFWYDAGEEGDEIADGDNREERERPSQRRRRRRRR